MIPAQPDLGVRRCARCGAASLYVVRQWQHRTIGLDTGVSTLDLECRGCGAKVVLHPWTEIRVEQVFAFVMMPAIFPGLFFWLRARKKARAWADNPLVEGGPSGPWPQTGEPSRRCECGASATCVAIVKEGRNLRIGTRHEYDCPVCSARFAVHDALGIAFMAFAGAVLCAVGALIILVPPGSAVGAESSNQGFGVALVVFSVIAWLFFAWRIRQRVVHPLAA